MRCPKCNAELLEDSKTCPQCGADLTAEQSAGTESTADKKTAEPEKKGKTKLIIGGIIAAAAVLICILAVSMMGGKDPKTAVIDAFKSVYKDETVKPMEEIFGFSELYQNSIKESTEVGMGIQIADSADPSVQALLGSGLTMEVKSDIPNKKSSGALGIQYNGMDFASADFYADDTNIMVGLPELSTRVFTLDYANDLEGQIENSPYLGRIVKENGLDISVFTDYVDYVKKFADKGTNDIFDIQGLWNRYKEGSKAIDNLKAAMTVTKKDKKVLPVDGKDVKCQGYDAVISNAAAVEFVKTTAKFFLEDEAFKKNILEYLNQVVSLSGQMSTIGMSAEEMQTEAWSQAQSMVDELVKNMESSMGDITMTVYVDKKGRMASLDMMTSIAVEDEDPMDIKLHADFKGGVYLTQNMSGDLTFTQGDENMSVTMEKNGTYDKKTLTCSLDLRLHVDNEDYALSYTGDYSVETGDYNMSLKGLEEEIEQFGISIKGIVSNLQKGKAIDVAIDSFSISAMGEDLITLSGDYSIKPLESEITVPEGDQMDILAADEAEWNSAATEITNNVFGLLMGIGQ